MMRKSRLAGLAALALACPALAQQPAPIENDLRCIAVLSAVTGNLPEGEQRAQMAAGLMYFIGHVEGQAPGIDLKAELKRILPQLTVAELAPESRRCGAVLVQKGTQLQDIGQDLSAAK